jgi:hypothetical protein
MGQVGHPASNGHRKMRYYKVVAFRVKMSPRALQLGDWYRDKLLL